MPVALILIRLNQFDGVLCDEEIGVVIRGACQCLASDRSDFGTGAG
jgi:hypothetical protein